MADLAHKSKRDLSFLLAKLLTLVLPLMLVLEEFGNGAIPQ